MPAPKFKEAQTLSCPGCKGTGRTYIILLRHPPSSVLRRSTSEAGDLHPTKVTSDKLGYYSYRMDVNVERGGQENRIATITLCETCNGVGQLMNCEGCGGTGEVDAQLAHGVMRVSCPLCAGRKFYKLLFMKEDERQ
jgi:RecJ-like exonuclease